MSRSFRVPINATVNNFGSASSYAGFLSASTASYAFYAGAQNNSGSAAQFSVTPAGTLTSNSASISGVVTFTSGTLGPFTVSSSALSSSSATFSASNVSISGNLTATSGSVNTVPIFTGLSQVATATTTASSTTASVRPTGFSTLTGLPAGTYQYDFNLFYQVSAATLAVKSLITASGASTISAGVSNFTNTTAISQVGSTNSSTNPVTISPTNAAAATTTLYQRISGIVNASAVTNFDYQFGVTSAGTASILPNSSLMLTKIA